MNIVCPQCGFSRDVTQENLPKEHVIATCPKCACRFRFSLESGAGEILPPKGWHKMADNKDKGEPAEEDIRITASNAYAREANRFADEQAAAKESAKQNVRRNPWADAPSNEGWLTAFYQTLIRVLFQAPAFFGNLSPRAAMQRPLAFFLLICLFQAIVERAWGQFFYSLLVTNAASDPQLMKLLEILAPSTNIFLTILFRTGFYILQLYVFSLLMFLAYRIVAKDRAVFNLVFQVMAYSSAPWVLCLIPGIGSLAGAIWSIGCLAAGCKAALRLSWGQTLVGFLPLLCLLLPVFGQMLGLSVSPG